ncbi:MAG TPA: hypothetical protein PLV92_10015, partial [Pirellulaceae bacterium]|nr:hypothetical protein [Pirellulaceae bacterium]
MGKPSNGRTGEPRRARVVRCWRRSRFETLEDRRLLAGLEQLGAVLADRVAEIRDKFAVYRDTDSALNHGVASGLFAGPDGTARAQTLRDSTIIATDCVFASTTSTQCATDPATLDGQRGTVLRVAFPALNAGEWVGLNIQEPQVAVGGSWHDLRGATRIEFDAYVSDVNGLPTGGLRTVEFGVLQHVAARALVVGSWTHVFLSLAADLGLTDADLNSSNPAHLSQPQVLFTVQTSVARSPLPLNILLDNIQYAPTPTSRGSVVGAPASNDVMGVVASAGEPYPADQVLANASFTYEQSLIVMAALHAAPDATRLAAAKQIADSFVYQLHHDHAAGPGVYGLPAATDGVSQFHGLHDGVHGGDIALLNDQPGGPSAGQLRLAEFTVPGSACGAGATTSYCVFADGGTGGNNAFAVLALVAAHRAFRESDPGAAAQYLDAAREIGNWIEYSLRDDSSIGDATHPGFGGYFLGYADRAATLAGARRLQTGKSLENVADIFAGYSQLAMIERERGDVEAAATWDERARHAGDFVLRMYDPSRNTFYAGTMPKSLAAAPGLTPAADCSAPGNDAYCQGEEVLNRFEFLDSISFPILALAGDVRYREAIDWRLPADRMLTQFHRTVMARGNLSTPRPFEGFNIVAAPTAGPGGREAGADGISWEFTGQVVATLRYVDQIYNESRYATPILKYQAELRRAYVGAPFANAARGVVAATMDEPAGRLVPRDQCVSTPFQCIAARIGTAATAWSYFAVAAEQSADKNSRAAANLFAPQWRIPEKTGESFTVEDWENKVTSNDLGFNNFGGNVGGVNQPSPDAGLPPAEQETRLIANTTVAPDPSTPGDFTAQIDFDFGLREAAVGFNHR